MHTLQETMSYHPAIQEVNSIHVCYNVYLDRMGSHAITLGTPPAGVIDPPHLETKPALLQPTYIATILQNSLDTN